MCFLVSEAAGGEQADLLGGAVEFGDVVERPVVFGVESPDSAVRRHAAEATGRWSSEAGRVQTAEAGSELRS